MSIVELEAPIPLLDHGVVAGYVTKLIYGPDGSISGHVAHVADPGRLVRVLKALLACRAPHLAPAGPIR